MSTNRDEILTAAANGNAAALEFLREFARRAHWVDDLADEKLGHPVWKLSEMECAWLMCLAANPFFLAHKAQLVPAMVLALNAWVDSELPKWEWQRRCDVIKGQWHEVVFLVAWLTGGWDKLRATSSQFRSYDFEPGSREGAKVPQLPLCISCGKPFDPQRNGSLINGFAGYCTPLCHQEHLLMRPSRDPAGKEANGTFR